MKKISSYLMFASFAYGVTDTCPIMEGDENDDESVIVEGKKISFVCGSCVTKFEENQAYYIKAVKSLYDKFTLLKERNLVLMM